MAIYNTSLPVVANIEAASGDDATAALRRALEAAGFEVYDDPEYPGAFEAEAGTTASDLPAARTVVKARPWTNPYW